MSISDIITRGYGSFGSIEDIITAGYVGTVEDGGAKKVRTSKPKKKKKTKVITEEQAEGMKAFGDAMMGIKPPEVIDIPEVIEAISEPIELLQTDDLIVSEFPEVEVLKPIEPTLQEKLEPEEDIGMILAIIAAHNSQL